MLRRVKQLPISVLLGALVLVFAVGTLAGRARAAPVRVFELDATPDFWRDSGYVEMVPPLRLPGRAATELRTSVWLRLPERSLLTVTEGAQGRPLLHYPPGTDAVRVEIRERAGRNGEVERSVADARGQHFSTTGSSQWFVLKPADRRDERALRGVSWPSDDARAHAEANRSIVEFSQKRLSPQQAARTASIIEAQNACPRCHTPARAEARQRGDFGEVARGTDGAGLFQIQSVLSDRAPLEAYAPRELNLDDPAIDVRCADGPAEVVTRAGGRAYQCEGQLVPIGYLNVPRALAAGDHRAQGLCEARRYLYQHLDEAGRRRFEAAFRVCGIAS